VLVNIKEKTMTKFKEVITGASGKQYEAMTFDPPIPEPVDIINQPPHYKTGGIETIDFIEAKELNYHLGNVVKYISRAKHKNNTLEDLEKAQWYLNRELEKWKG
jgi:hypothetical protein